MILLIAVDAKNLNTPEEIENLNQHIAYMRTADTRTQLHQFAIWVDIERAEIISIKRRL